MDNYEIDVIIPFHAVNSYLPISISSIKSSVGIKVRVIAVNDTGIEISKDDIGLGIYDVLVRNNGIGYLDALSTGVTKIESDYVGFQDSDDLTDSTRLYRQVKSLILNDYDLVSGKIIKINSKGRIAKDKPVFGRLPLFFSPEQKLIFGPHGADSTLVAKASLIKKTWNLHSNFSQFYADYGWVLSILPNIRIGYCDNAIYYYRSHRMQMSRKVSNSSELNKLLDLWINNYLFLTSRDNLSCLEDELRLKSMSKSILAIAIPAFLPTLNKEERFFLKYMIKEIGEAFDVKSKKNSDVLNHLLFRRGLIATRGRCIAYWPQLIPLISDLVRNIFNGIFPRFYSRDK